MVQQGHGFPAEVAWVRVGVCVEEDACISNPFKGRRIDYLTSHFYDTVAYVKDLEIEIHKFRNTDVTLEEIPFCTL